MTVEVLARWLGLYRRMGDARAVVALLVANAIPLVGALFLGWSLWTILAIYWLENGIVGLYSLAKILLAQGDVAPGLDAVARARLNAIPAVVHRALFAIFFPIHYGFFWVGHGVFVLGFLPAWSSLATRGGLGGPSAVAAAVDWPAAALGAATLVVSHGISFLVNFLWRGEFRSASPAALVSAPYARVIVLHLTILFGAWAVILLGTPVAALLVLVLVKTVLDLRAHLRERRSAGARVAAGGA